MRKNILAISLLLMVLVAACGSNTPTNEPNNGGQDSKETTSVSETKNEEATDSHSSIEVDENLLTVEISVPATFVGEDLTQEDVDKAVQENGYVSGKLNSDGSVTYKMTKGKHKELMAKIKDTIDTQMGEMVGSEDYPNIVNIEANDDYTSFTITTKSTELGLMESMSTLAFYMYGGMYNAFSGEQVDNIHVDFVNEETGQVIQSADSKNMGSGG
ncbi:hypothetical protein [Butyrivibrio proteoclasticus]|uniref:hypothetical protein n=1 Tax=Butyrivibrio proteoclasticus TaxID=43305 RepID=UPI00047AEBC0|nr:hypothetical protein [Butyrivibrio proteoclasticus]